MKNKVKLFLEYLLIAGVSGAVIAAAQANGDAKEAVGAVAGAFIGSVLAAARLAIPALAAQLADAKDAILKQIFG